VHSSEIFYLYVCVAGLWEEAKRRVIKIDLIEALKRQIYFCNTNENYKCGIWITSEIKSDLVINVISNLVWNQKKTEIRNKFSVRFSNGSSIKVVRANSTARGNIFNGMIIDSAVSKEIVDTVILLCLRPLFVENRYNNNDNPTDKMYFCDITEDDVIKSEKYKPILYISSARGSGRIME